MTRLAPFGAAFMALFGRGELPHRSSLSRFLADVDRPCARSLSHAVRAVQLYRRMDESQPLVASLIDKDAETPVFDVDATRQAAAPSCITLRSDTSSCTTPPQCRLCTGLQGA